jgi:hypothetical protein
MIWASPFFVGSLLLVCKGVGATQFIHYTSTNTTTTPIYSDLIEFFPNASNIVPISLDLVLGGLTTPNMTDNATVAGFDWTVPWPGTSVNGHGANLRVAFDVSLPGDIVQDATTNVAALTFPIPAVSLSSHLNINGIHTPPLHLSPFKSVAVHGHFLEPLNNGYAKLGLVEATNIIC